MTDPQAVAAPRTEAGRDFLRDFEAWMGADFVPALQDRILAIEAEARQPDSEALRRADEAASIAHDYIWPQKHPVDAIGDEVPSVTREEASDAIWTIHNTLRPLLAAERKGQTDAD